MYGSERWVWQKKSGSRINAVEMRSLRGMCGVSREDRCRNSDVRERCGLKEDVVTRVERVCCGGLAIWRGGMKLDIQFMGTEDGLCFSREIVLLYSEVSDERASDRKADGWSAPPMDDRRPRAVTCALPAFYVFSSSNTLYTNYRTLSIVYLH
ncbi:hypothetical protein EVAR_51916_1 [Eumeta japonica]|uniref:Uncharacterized protein n=1 Tax=Eumeta variegata TaxID=151549 RepID=A0A4C1XHV2_EUMVA|nr:hypothetical protein EVAR_51916_1 [Eumeta japonica]